MSLHTTDLGDHGSRIVFCHGLFGQGRNWTQVGKALAVDHRVTLVDMPHHGRSSWPEEFDYVDVADRVAELLTADDPVTLVGHSMGGKAAMVLALRHPELVDRLCVVDISPVAYAKAGEFRGYIDAMQGMDLSALAGRADAEAALSSAVPTRRSGGSCSRTCGGTGTAGAGRPTSTCSVATCAARRLARRGTGRDRAVRRTTQYYRRRQLDWCAPSTPAAMEHRLPREVRFITVKGLGTGSAPSGPMLPRGPPAVHRLRGRAPQEAWDFWRAGCRPRQRYKSAQVGRPLQRDQLREGRAPRPRSRRSRRPGPDISSARITSIIAVAVSTAIRSARDARRRSRAGASPTARAAPGGDPRGAGPAAR